jgi:hypothetical protein
MAACAVLASLVQDRRFPFIQAAAGQICAWGNLSGACGAADIGRGPLGPEASRRYLQSHALNALMKLQLAPAVRDEVPEIMLEIMGDSSELQRAMADSSALEHLCSLVCERVRRVRFFSCVEKKN